MQNSAFRVFIFTTLYLSSKGIDVIIDDLKSNNNSTHNSNLSFTNILDAMQILRNVSDLTNSATVINNLTIANSVLFDSNVTFMYLPIVLFKFVKNHNKIVDVVTLFVHLCLISMET